MATKEQNREAAARYAAMDNASKGTPIPSHLQSYVDKANKSSGGGGTGAFGLPDPMSGRIVSVGGLGGLGGGYTSFGDRFDGGGPGKRGDTFGGFFGGVSNAFGATPKGSGIAPTGLAKGASALTGIGGKMDPVASAALGLATGGIGGLAMGLARAKIQNKMYDKAQAKKATASGLGSLTNTPATSGPRYTTSSNTNRGEGRDAALAAEATPLASAVKAVKPLNMTEQAAAGAYAPIPNPDYDPTNPMSPMWITNPTFEQLSAFRTAQLSTPQTTYMAEGGSVDTPPAPQGAGNEKSIIVGAAAAIKGELDEQSAAMALGAFVQKYGKDSLKDFVDRVQSGELDQTIEKSSGKIAGPGDGMSDHIPASVGGKQDVLLSDGEFIVPADVVSGLGNGSSEAGAKQLEKFMERIRSDRTGKSEQPKAIDPAAVLPA